MLTTLATLAALAFTQQTDTTVPVRAGARLEINNFGGEIAVKTWNRNAVRVVADHSSRDRISVDASEQVVRVKTEPGRRGPSQIDYAVTVPAWMALTPRTRSPPRPCRARSQSSAGRATCRSNPSWEP